MRFKFFIFSALCLCYVISAFPNDNFAENKLETNRPKRTIILKTMIKKLIWQNFSNLVNLPITRKPPINLATSRNRTPSSTSTLTPTSTSTATATSESPTSSASGPSYLDYGDTTGNTNNIPTRVGSGLDGNNNSNKQTIAPSAEANRNNAPTSSSAAEPNNAPNLVDSSFSGPGNDQRNSQRKQITNGFGSDSGSFANQNGGRNGASNQQDNNSELPTGPSGAQNYGSTSDRSAKQNSEQPTGTQEQNYGPTAPNQQYGPRGDSFGVGNFGQPSGRKDPNYGNYVPTSDGFSFPAPDQYNNRRNNPETQQSNNSGIPSVSSAEQNDKQKSGGEEQNYGPTLGPSVGQNYQPTAGSRAEENYGQSSRPKDRNYPNYGEISGDFRPYYPEKQQSNNFGRPAEQNYKQTSGPEEQNYRSTERHNKLQYQQPKEYQSSILNDEQFIDDSFNQNKPFQSYYSNSGENNHNTVNQLKPTISDAESSRFPSQQNSQFENLGPQNQIQGGHQNNPNSELENFNKESFIQDRNPAEQSIQSSSPFLMNYPQHQHYQQLIPSVNKISNSNHNPEVPQNNYHHQQIYNYERDSSDFNQFNQPVLNFYSPEQYY